MSDNNTVSSRRVFLSPLGTGNYAECVYAAHYGTPEEKRSGVQKFIQCALARLYGDNWDAAYIITTNTARERHFDALVSAWPDNVCAPVCLSIPEGKNETELWEIFQTIYGAINQNDDILFDITHGFRSLPFITGSLLQYAKALKNVKLSKIVYGAYESSPGFSDKNIPPGENIAPIFDLTAFSVILDWSDAAFDFINNGSAKKFSSLAQRAAVLKKKEIKRKEVQTDAIMKIAQEAAKLTADLETNRGKNIIKAESAHKIQESITALDGKDIFLPALKPILGKLSEALVKLNQNPDDPMNMLNAVDRQIEKQSVQSGFTLLQEGIITYLLKDDARIYNVGIRLFVSAYLQNGDAPDFDYKRFMKDDIDMNILKKYAVLIDKLPNLPDLREIYRNITDARNDINHAGMGSNPRNTVVFYSILPMYYEQTKKYFGIS